VFVNPVYVIVLAGLWIGSLMAAAGLTWALTRVSARDASPITINVALDKGAEENTTANRTDHTQVHDRNGVRAKDEPADGEAERERLSRAYLKLALQRLVESAMARSGKPASPASAANPDDRDPSEPLFPTAARLLSDETGSWLGETRGSGYPALEEIVTWLDQWDDSISIQDLFARPEMLESTGGMLERVMDELSGLQGQFAGRMSGMGQGLSANLEPLLKTLESLSALREEGLGDGTFADELGALMNGNGWGLAQNARQRLGLLFLLLLRHNAEKAGIAPPL